MRVMIGDKILFCIKVVKVDNKLTLYTSEEYIKTVEFKDFVEAHIYYNKLLRDGYLDLTDYKVK